MLSDTLQHIDEIVVWIDIAQPTGHQRALHDTDVLGAEFGATEQPIFGFCRKVWYLGQNGKTDRNYFKNLQCQKLTKNKLCDRTGATLVDGDLLRHATLIDGLAKEA